MTKIIKKTKSKYSKVKQFKITSPLVSRIFLGIVILLLTSLILKLSLKLIMFWVFIIFVNVTMENARLRANLPADFELSTFSTVLVTVVFGWQLGVITAIFSKLITSLATGNLLADHFFMIVTYLNGAIWAFLLKGMFGIFPLGMIIVTMNCILMWMISKNIIGVDITSNISYTGTNFVFNFLVFSIFSQLFYSFLI